MPRPYMPSHQTPLTPHHRGAQASCLCHRLEACAPIPILKGLVNAAVGPPGPGSTGFQPVAPPLTPLCLYPPLIDVGYNQAASRLGRDEAAGVSLALEVV
jgi:hypothetical protein